MKTDIELFSGIDNECDLSAFEDNDSLFSDSISVYEIDDPNFAPDLIRMVEESVAKNELRRIVELIRNLSDYIQSNSENDHSAATDKQALIRQANCILAIYDN